MRETIYFLSGIPTFLLGAWATILLLGRVPAKVREVREAKREDGSLGAAIFAIMLIAGYPLLLGFFGVGFGLVGAALMDTKLHLGLLPAGRELVFDTIALPLAVGFFSLFMLLGGTERLDDSWITGVVGLLAAFFGSVALVHIVGVTEGHPELMSKSWCAGPICVMPIIILVFLIKSANR